MRAVVGDVRLPTGEVESSVLYYYYPYGFLREGGSYRYGYNGMLREDAIAGAGNTYDFGARLLSSLYGRWFSIDPLAGKYPSFSPYVAMGGNPILFIDPDGRDIVKYNSQGVEIARTISKTDFKTIIVNSEGAEIEVAMPKIITKYEKPIYQRFDYDIAAHTYLFNDKIKNNRSLLPVHSKNHKLSKDGLMPSELDPTLIKAMVIEESQVGTYKGALGTGLYDIMQVNNPGDEAGKNVIGITLSDKVTPSQSIQKGIEWLYLKGMKSDKNGNMSWRSDDSMWFDAVKRYNGGGNPKYLEEVKGLYNSSKDAMPSNYYEETKK